MEKGSDNAVDLIFWRDEILQLMYWLEGENLSRAVSVEDLNRFLRTDETIVNQALTSMLQNELIEQPGQDRFALTEAGRVEGGRRFADEFEPMLKPGHFECDEPDCDCHDPASVGFCKNLAPEVSSVMES